MILRKQQPGKKSACRAPGVRLRLEALEDRLALSGTSPLPPATSVSVSASAYSPTDIIVQYSPGQTPFALPGTSIGPQLALVTGLYQINLSQGVSVSQALAEYSAAGVATLAEPDYILTSASLPSSAPNTANFNQQWALQNTGQNGGTPGDDIGAVQAWAVASGAEPIIVAVTDTGVDYTDSDLYDNIWINQADIPASRLKNLVDVDHDGYISMADLQNPINQGPGKIEKLDGKSYIDASDLLQPMILNAQGQDTDLGGWVNPNDPDAADGLIGDLIGWNFSANNNTPMDQNGHGTHVAGIIAGSGNDGGALGVDPNVLIMPVQFMDSSGNGTVSQYIEALNYAVSHGAKIVNNSWTGADPSTALYEAILNAQNHGIIFVAAAGNSGTDNDTTAVYPADFSTYTGDGAKLNNVVAVAATDDNDNLASFSNYGVASVAIAAPGVNILSTLPGGTYGDKSGTSMAAPMVTGALALVWGEHPTWTYTQVINQVLSTVTHVASLADEVSSGGVLNVAAAVGVVEAASTPPEVVSASASGPTANSLSTIQVTYSTAMSLSSFTPSSVTILTSFGKSLTITGVSVAANTGDRTFNITFATQTTAGTYTLYVNSNPTDLSGDHATKYQASYKIAAASSPPASPSTTPVTSTAPYVVSASASGPTANSLSTIQVTYSTAMNLSSFTPSSVTILTSFGKSLTITGVSVAANTGDRTFNITFATQTTAGTYTLYVNSNPTDLSGDHATKYQASYKIAAASSPPASSPSTTPVTSTAPYVVSASASGPTANSLSTIQVTYSTAMSLSSFTPSSVTILTSFGKSLTITGVSVAANTGDRTFNITFATQTTAGTYTLYLNSNPTDLSDNHATKYQASYKIAAAAPVTSPSPTTFKSTTSLAITSNGTTASLLNVSASGDIGSVTVNVDIKFPTVGALDLILQAPDGAEIVLAPYVGGTTANMLNTTFSDSASTSVAFAPGALGGGTFQPITPLSNLSGKAMSGTWKLWIANKGSNTGTLLDWSLTITPSSS